MKGKLLEYTAIAVVIIWIVAFFWILSVSTHCSEIGTITETQGCVCYDDLQVLVVSWALN
jgi:hypothetical protein